MMHTILLAFGDEELGERWGSLLEDAVFTIERCMDRVSLVNSIALDSPSILLLGNQLLDINALEILKELGANQPFPIIVMMQNVNPQETIAAFDQGANDVVGEYIDAQELKSRIRNLIRLFWRFADSYLKELQYEDLRMDLKSRKAYRVDEQIKLTPKEFDLLRYLMKRAGIVCDRELILKEVWGYDFATGTNVVDVYIRHLRSKIDKGHSKKLIHTIRGQGYMIH